MKYNKELAGKIYKEFLGWEFFDIVEENKNMLFIYKKDKEFKGYSIEGQNFYIHNLKLEK